MSYEQLLEQAYDEVKPIKTSRDFDRWELPKIDVSISGNKTTISNFGQVCSYIRRTQEDLCKFLSKELAAYCKHEGDRLVLNRKLSKERIEEKINLYVSKFVVCQECKKPDTELVKKEGFTFIHCLACGAKHSLGKV
jgi:translation initiation factor 2 subunit 2